ncbi:HNH endonuclease signature motif containing protein [uncultured Rhodospira sp.]|uniref:HNH endonuclease signature motif containing protein n=1 Tax=uncultured Rhodospira sp. TaxID=1936189 RepID=UPI0026332EA2|nr:HNH endonuclease signature motif containing protein [uncultured Rhodospira sp.]
MRTIRALALPPEWEPDFDALPIWRDPDTGCWIWGGWNDGKGYGKLSIAGTTWYAHRAMYARFRGPIPLGHVLDHVVCKNPRCVNPWHLEPVTVRVNTHRGRAVLYTKGTRP